MSLHVVPIGDLIEHETTDGCPCGPAQRPVVHDGTTRLGFVHHSLDGREQYEPS